MSKYLIPLIGLVGIAAGGPVYAAACITTDIASASIDTTDVTFAVSGNTAEAADACSGVTMKNAPEDNPGTTNFGFGGDNFDFVVKDQNSSGPSSGSWWGIDFTLTGFMQADSGSYTLTWADTNGSLPKIVDIVVVLKASDRYASWLFDDETLTATNSPGSGEWEINFLNNGGEIPNLSHLNVYMRHDGTPPPPPPGLIEPGTLGLLMMGFLGTAAARRFGKIKKHA